MHIGPIFSSGICGTEAGSTGKTNLSISGASRPVSTSNSLGLSWTDTPPPPLFPPATFLPSLTPNTREAVALVETRRISAKPCACARACVCRMPGRSQQAHRPAQKCGRAADHRRADMGSGACCGSDWRPPCVPCVTTTNMIAPITGCSTRAQSLRRPVPRGQGQATDAVLGLGGAATSGDTAASSGSASQQPAASSCGRS